jgi:hypothetical protein
MGLTKELNRFCGCKVGIGCIKVAFGCVKFGFGCVKFGFDEYKSLK